MERHIVHLDLDAFFVSVERLRNAALKGIPLLIGGMGDRGVVAAASYEARKYGVHSAMPMKLARKLCPEARIIRGDAEEYSKMSHVVTDIIASKVPVYEKSSIDEFYIDLSGMDRFFGCTQYTAHLKQYILKESGLVVSYGLSTNKLLSKVGTNEVKPDGGEIIPAGEEKAYLAPLRIDKMPMIGKKTADLLYSMGVNTIRLLSEIPRPMLEQLLGRNGSELWRKANGIDDTPIVPYNEQKSVSAENTFGQDITDTQWLKGQLVRLTERVGFELREQHKLAGCLTLKIRYAGFDTYTKQVTIPYTAMDHILVDKAKELFDRLYDRRQRVRLIGVRLSRLVPGNYQIDIFDDTREKIALYQAVDQMKHKYGSRYLSKAVTGLRLSDELQSLHAPEESPALREARLKDFKRQTRKPYLFEIRKRNAHVSQL
ncbi:DNA polymerase IV [Taibaiella koreensis]|uniref:DNA polymerase IV n=1 Tax=Taibaiella koreensis TaxID=1268548 RepID=UPI000E59F2BD|nr:DNA polymerase IV [Taibaiella koreensis]